MNRLNQYIATYPHDQMLQFNHIDAYSHDPIQYGRGELGLSNRESGGATKEGDRMEGESADVAGGAGGGGEPRGGRAKSNSLMCLRICHYNI